MRRATDLAVALAFLLLAPAAALAQVGSPEVGKHNLLLSPPAAAGTVAATVWDSSHCATADLMLSNSNTTVTRTGGGNSNDWCFTVSPGSAGQLIYVETTWTTWTNALIGGFGVDDTISSNRFAGANNTPSTGAVNSNAAQLVDNGSGDAGNPLLPSTVSPGDLVDYALNSTTHRMWARQNNGAWTGSGDPALGTGGVAVVTTPNSQYYFFYGADGISGDSMTARFASTSWVHTPPSGYSQINGP